VRLVAIELETVRIAGKVSFETVPAAPTLEASGGK
jgi:hypothetical protein